MFVIKLAMYLPVSAFENNSKGPMANQIFAIVLEITYDFHDYWVIFFTFTLITLFRHMNIESDVFFHLFTYYNIAFQWQFQKIFFCSRETFISTLVLILFKCVPRWIFVCLVLVVMRQKNTRMGIGRKKV